MLFMSVERKKDACRILFGRLCEKYNVHNWDIRFDGCGIRTNAYASYQQQAVCISKRFLRCASKKQLHEIILHEFAHILAPRDGRHGKDWQAACRKVGLETPTTYVTSPLSARSSVKCHSCGKSRRLFALARKSQCRKCRSHNVSVTTYPLKNVREAEHKLAVQTAAEFADSLEFDSKSESESKSEPKPESESESTWAKWLPSTL